MLDSIVSYYNNYLRRNDPITNVQKVALTALMSMTDTSVQIPETFGEAVETIQYLHNLWKSTK